MKTNKVTEVASAKMDQVSRPCAGLLVYSLNSPGKAVAFLHVHFSALCLELEVFRAGGCPSTNIASFIPRF